MRQPSNFDSEEARSSAIALSIAMVYLFAIFVLGLVALVFSCAS